MHALILANHLDLGAVVWLEAYLSTYNHILVVRAFPLTAANLG